MVQERPDYSVIGNVTVAALPQTGAAPAVNVVRVDDTVGGTTLVAAYAGRILLMVQNVGMAACYIRLGATASTANYHLILAAGIGLEDGTGGGLVLDAYTGVVSAICAAGLETDLAVTEL